MFRLKLKETRSVFWGVRWILLKTGFLHPLPVFSALLISRWLKKENLLLVKSFRFIIEKENGELIRLEPGKLAIKEQTPSKVIWNVLNTSKECDLECIGQMEFDGFVDYQLKLTAKVPLKIKDIRLEIPVVKEKAEYMMGLGQEGGFRSPNFKWKWDVSQRSGYALGRWR